MNGARVDLKKPLLLAAAAPIWIILITMVPNGTGFGGGPFRFVAAPLVLAGITVAIQRLLRGVENSWLIAGLTAGMIALAALLIAVWLQ